MIASFAANRASPAVPAKHASAAESLRVVNCQNQITHLIVDKIIGTSAEKFQKKHVQAVLQPGTAKNNPRLLIVMHVWLAATGRDCKLFSIEPPQPELVEALKLPRRRLWPHVWLDHCLSRGDRPSSESDSSFPYLPFRMCLFNSRISNSSAILEGQSLLLS